MGKSTALGTVMMPNSLAGANPVRHSFLPYRPTTFSVECGSRDKFSPGLGIQRCQAGNCDGRKYLPSAVTSSLL